MEGNTWRETGLRTNTDPGRHLNVLPHLGVQVHLLALLLDELDGDGIALSPWESPGSGTMVAAR
jgi:hypothetical protein